MKTDRFYPDNLPKYALFFFFLLFLAGRFGLIVHEFLGHGLAATLLAGGVTSFRLFPFGGGMIGWRYPETDGFAEALTPHLLIHLGGIAAELAVGLILLSAVRFRRFNSVLAGLGMATSALLIIHGLFYLATGVFHGGGDGRLLFQRLDREARLLLLFFAVLSVPVSAFFLSLCLSPALKARLPEGASPAEGARLLLLSGILAILLHAALTSGERRLAEDARYTFIKAPQHRVLAQKALERAIDLYTARHGRPPDERLFGRMKARLRRKYRKLPIEIPLSLAVGVALMLGYAFSPKGRAMRDKCVAWEEVRMLALASGLAVVVILALNSAAG